LAKEGIPYIILFSVPAVLFGVLGWWIAAGLCLLLMASMALFFRNPERACPVDDRLIISPADGRVVVVTPVEPSKEDSPTQISIFLSLIDVHITRSPIAGEIVEAVYKPGKFHIASRDIASVENEQNFLKIRGSLVTIDVRQIAGVLARRVVLWKKQGDRVQLGERIGLMKFSSRMDVIVPPEVEVLVRPDERVVAGITVLGRVRCD
jgi:phosphatidylserine decarboxylase